MQGPSLPQPGRRDRTLMNKIWLAFIAFAAYGSLWPFDFVWQTPDLAMLDALTRTLDRRPIPRDMVGNVLLFVPIGALGMLSAPPGEATWRRCLWVFLVC